MDIVARYTTRMVNLMRTFWNINPTHYINGYAVIPGEEEPGFNGEWIEGEFIPIYDELMWIDKERKRYFATRNG